MVFWSESIQKKSLNVYLVNHPAHDKVCAVHRLLSEHSVSCLGWYWNLCHCSPSPVRWLLFLKRVINYFYWIPFIDTGTFEIFMLAVNVQCAALLCLSGLGEKDAYANVWGAYEGHSHVLLVGGWWAGGKQTVPVLFWMKVLEVFWVEPKWVDVTITLKKAMEQTFSSILFRF